MALPPLISKWGLVLSAVTGTTGVFAQTMIAQDATSVERLGTAGVLVVAAYSMLRYFMSELGKKDTYIERVTREHSEALLTELRASSHAKAELAVALHGLADAVRERR